MCIKRTWLLSHTRPDYIQSAARSVDRDLHRTMWDVNVWNSCGIFTDTKSSNLWNTIQYNTNDELFLFWLIDLLPTSSLIFTVSSSGRRYSKAAARRLLPVALAKWWLFVIFSWFSLALHCLSLYSIASNCMQWAGKICDRATALTARVGKNVHTYSLCIVL